MEAKLSNLNLNVTRDEMDNSSIKGDRIIDFNSNPDIGVLNILEDKSNPLPVSIFHSEFYFPFKTKMPGLTPFNSNTRIAEQFQFAIYLIL